MKGMLIMSSLLMLLQSICTQNTRFKAMADNLNADRKNTNRPWKARASTKFDYSDKNIKSLVGKNTILSKNHPKYKAWQKDGHLPNSNSGKPSRRLQTVNVPDSLDLRVKYSFCWSIGYPRDQSGCGSCWAISGTSVLSDGYCIKYSKANSVRQRSFSAQDVMENCPNEICQQNGNGCVGGMINGVFEYAKATGVVTGENYGNFTTCKPYFLAPKQYADTTPTPTKVCVDPVVYRRTYVQDQLKIYDYYFISGQDLQEMVANMKISLSTGGSILAYFEVYEDFLVYASGVYVITPNSQIIGGHGLVIIGYGTENNIPYWLCRNTWGVFWGDKGFVKIRQGTNEGKIESLVMEVFL